MEEPKKWRTLDQERATKANLKKAITKTRQLNRARMKKKVREDAGDGDGLTLRERTFVEAYLVDFDAVRAATVAGYASDPKANPYSILQRRNIKAMVAKRKEELKKEITVDQGRMVKEYFNIAYSDISSYYTIDEDGYSKFKMWEDLTTEQRAAVSEVSFGIDRDGNRFITRIKLFDKMRALEGLGKHLGFFEKDNKQKSEVSVTIEQVINELPVEIQDAIRHRMLSIGRKAEEYGEGQETRH